MKTDHKVRLLFAVCCTLVLFVSGCSVTPKVDPNIAYEPPKHQAEDVLREGVVYASDVYDPWEGMNRRIYSFNYYFDKFIFLPIVRTYEFITPDYVEDRVSNFVDNVFEFNNFTNNLLQLKFKRTGITLVRFVVNTTVGVAGLWDPATGWGMPRQTEDFGQTLGHYGVGHGPYIVLPILGPSNLRDTTGFVGDTLAFNNFGPPYWVDDDDVALAFTVVSAIDKRHRESFRYYQSGSPFEYGMIRMLYTSKREIEIAK
ncbi:MAG: VacJ family lipoprotein [Deltaproteobacteria bacterium]|nr:VacJ family lipoprotein [Deltaproteobacteria bacterium]MBW2476555.1 VacJ family lipoprotein [Deltaproteobacteria bacterium]MBW2503271.1 VacJ family lipoprotein [Deltaproteobacteria bacterium]MBW2520849.1 VacJ family lipoprotein [Deltaproteobacteria bacterium]